MELENKSKGQGKKCDLVEGIRLRGVESGNEKKKPVFVAKEVSDILKEEGRSIKCQRSNY